MNPICFFKGIKRTLINFLLSGYFDYISGHELIEVNEGQPKNILLIKCTVCGKYITSW